MYVSEVSFFFYTGVLFVRIGFCFGFAGVEFRRFRGLERLGIRLSACILQASF